MSKEFFISTPIKKIGKIVTGKTPLTEKSEFYNGSILFISPTELHNGFYITSSAKTITEEGLNSIKSNSISGLSVLVGCIGWDMGNVALCNSTCATNQQINSITEFKSEYNPHYIFYWLSTKKEYLFSIASVTRTPILSKGAFEEIEIPLPSKNVQDKVSNVLTSIDTKIALNNRIIAELEAMAKTIYDYWFVQFNFPNAEGKPYRQSGGEMVYNETLKREIPKGWKNGNLYDIADFVNGLACQKHRPLENERGIPVIKIREMHEGITLNTELVSENIPERHKIYRGDILFSWSATLEAMFWFGEPGGLNQHIFKVVPKTANTKIFVFHQLSAYIINFIKMAEARKTTMGHITTEHLHQSLIALPDQDIIKNFEILVSPMQERILKFEKENHELTRLRDWLLPMRMNGQATVE